MNKKVLYTAFAYSIFVIIFKLLILLGGYQLTRFGFYYSHVITVFLVVPFMIIAVKLVRDKDQGGKIGGRDALKIALGVAGISVIILSIYNYVEFEWKLKELSKLYYSSDDYLNFLKKNPKIKPENYSKIIEENSISLSSFRAVTAKLFSFLIISSGSAFLTAVFMKKK